MNTTISISSSSDRCQQLRCRPALPAIAGCPAPRNNGTRTLPCVYSLLPPYFMGQMKIIQLQRKFAMKPRYSYEADGHGERGVVACPSWPLIRPQPTARGGCPRFGFGRWVGARLSANARRIGRAPPPNDCEKKCPRTPAGASVGGIDRARRGVLKRADSLSTCATVRSLHRRTPFHDILFHLGRGVSWLPEPSLHIHQTSLLRDQEKAMNSTYQKTLFLIRAKTILTATCYKKIPGE